MRYCVVLFGSERGAQVHDLMERLRDEECPATGPCPMRAVEAVEPRR